MRKVPAKMEAGRRASAGWGALLRLSLSRWRASSAGRVVVSPSISHFFDDCWRPSFASDRPAAALNLRIHDSLPSKPSEITPYRRRRLVAVQKGDEGDVGRGRLTFEPLLRVSEYP